jgi:hypothetical protein
MAAMRVEPILSTYRFSRVCDPKWYLLLRNVKSALLHSSSFRFYTDGKHRVHLIVDANKTMTRIFSSGCVLWFVLLPKWCSFHHSVMSFVPNYPSSVDRRRRRQVSLSAFVEPSESSSLLPYISNYLKKMNQASIDETSNPSYNHYMIAIPMDVRINSELLLELESIQRAIIFHCPLMVHSCLSTLSTATLRVPLLYLSIPCTSFTQKEHVLPTLTNIVETAIQKVPSLDNYRQLSCHSLEIAGGPIHNAHEVLSVQFGDSNKTTAETPWNDVVREMQLSVQYLFPDAIVRTPADWLRMPFMRLPPDWNDYLREQYRQLHSGDGDKTDDDESALCLTADQGGNGISPVHWEQYAQDQFSFQRFSSLAIYSHLPPPMESKFAWDERQFPSVAAMIPLSRGDNSCTTPTQHEAQFAAYQEQRVFEAEKIWKEELRRENAERFQTSKSRFGNSLTSEVIDSVASRTNIDEDGLPKVDFDQTSQSNISSLSVDVEARRIVSSRPRMVQEQLEQAKVLKEPQDHNPIFDQYRNKTLVPPANTTAPLDLPVFPSRECCIGVWHMIRSPTGFDVQDDAQDNLILRVDGQIAGGPILDPSQRQKAAGGDWTYQDGRTLRVRFLIPPLKQRVLVMEGRLELLSMKPALPLATNTFGIPALEELSGAESLDDRIVCSGAVWMEDVEGSSRRDEVGTFTMIKSLPPLDMSQITITIPRNVRNVD